MKKFALILISILFANCNVVQEKANKKTAYIHFEYKTLLNDTNSITSKINLINKVIENKKIQRNSGEPLYYSKSLRNEKYDIITEQFDSWYQEPPYKRAKIHIYNDEYYVDSLVYNTINDTIEPIGFDLVAMSEFNIQNNQYIAFLSLNSYKGTDTSPEFLLIIFEIFHNKSTPIFAGFQASTNFDCISDFNNDNILDIAFWRINNSINKNKICFYTLKCDKFVIQKNIYISVVEHSPYNYMIDIENSSWFFDFVEQYPNKLIYK